MLDFEKHRFYLNYLWKCNSLFKMHTESFIVYFTNYDANYQIDRYFSVKRYLCPHFCDAPFVTTYCWFQIIIHPNYQIDRYFSVKRYLCPHFSDAPFVTTYCWFQIIIHPKYQIDRCFLVKRFLSAQVLWCSLCNHSWFPFPGQIVVLWMLF